MGSGELVAHLIAANASFTSLHALNLWQVRLAGMYSVQLNELQSMVERAVFTNVRNVNSSSMAMKNNLFSRWRIYRF
jgi:hypothetical protein